MRDRLDAYFKEYEMLAAETRIWLAASDPKVTVAFAACLALAGAGAWNNHYPLILLIPLVVLFLALILVFQLDNIVHLAAQLAVLEERINSLLDPTEPTLTYYSKTVLTIFDQPIHRDPSSGRARVSINVFYGIIVLGGLALLSLGATLYGVPKLAVGHPAIARAYAAFIIGGSVIVIYLLYRASTAKKWYLGVIRQGFGGPTSVETKVGTTPRDSAPNTAAPADPPK